MRSAVLPATLAVMLAATAATVAFISIPPSVAPAPRSSYVDARSVAVWPGGILMSGYSKRSVTGKARDPEWRHWLAEVHGAEVRELEWPPAYLNVPNLGGIVLCGAVGERVAVVAEGRRGGQRVSRLLLWDGVEWEMLPLVRGGISSVVAYDGHLVIGGDFPVNTTTSLRVMYLVAGQWLPFGGGLPLPRAGLEVHLWRGAPVAVVRPWYHSAAADTCLWRWVRGQWAPMGPTFRFSSQPYLKAVVWDERLVIGGNFSGHDGNVSAGLIMLDGDGTVSAPAARAGRGRQGEWSAVPVGVWDGMLVLEPMWPPRASLLILDDGELVPMPRMPTGERSYGAWPRHVSISGRDIAVLAQGNFEGAGIPHEPVYGRRQLAIWHDGSWWVPSLEILED